MPSLVYLRHDSQIKSFHTMEQASAEFKPKVLNEREFYSEVFMLRVRECSERNDKHFFHTMEKWRKRFPYHGNFLHRLMPLLNAWMRDSMLNEAGGSG